MATVTELADKVEQVSRIYAERCARNRDDDWFALKLTEEAGELVAEYLRITGRGRRREGAMEALADEAADLFAQVLLFCRHNGIDIESALERKWFKYLDEAEKA
jgi:NTP pyrophosphatase (non-canonical NTP hydrolase)